MNETNAQIAKKESTPPAMESIRNRAVFAPAVDILEAADEIVLFADLPGVDENALDIVFENGVLTIRGSQPEESTEGFDTLFREYRSGDYERTFSVSDEIDHERIKAMMKNGVLRLSLPKAATAKPKKIAIEAD